MIRGLALVLALSQLSAADPAEIRLSLIRTGAGFLAARPETQIPLGLWAESEVGPVSIVEATVSSALGRVSGVRTTDPGLVEFLYRPPTGTAEPGELERLERLTIQLVVEGGPKLRRTLELRLSSVEPGLQLLADPPELSAEFPAPVRLEAVGSGPDLEQLRVYSSHGSLSEPDQAQGPAERLTVASTLVMPELLPTDAPSYFLTLAAVTDPYGYTLTPHGLAVLARIRVRTQAPAGTTVELEGTEDPVESIAVDASRAVQFEARVRYGSPIRAVAFKDNENTELPVVVPQGLVPLALVAPLPGQNQADGGTGPTLALLVPPSPFGDEALWPDIQVEGARVVSVRALRPNLRVLSLARPSTPKTIVVLADGEPLASVAFGGSHGATIKAETLPSEPGIRGLARVSVRDRRDFATDAPRPQISEVNGRPIRVTRTGIGEYRVELPAEMPGSEDEAITLLAEIAPPRVLAGAPIGPTVQYFSVPLSGPAPVAPIRAAQAEVARAEAPRRSLGIGLEAFAYGGLSLSEQYALGGGARFSLRFPFWNQRLGAALAAEFLRMSSVGTVTLPGQAGSPATLTVTGALFPAEVFFSFLKGERFDLHVRGGAVLRLERTTLRVSNQSPLATEAVLNLAYRAGIGGAVRLGPGALTMELLVDAIGHRADRLGGEQLNLSGLLTYLRFGAGYRFEL